jgi:murein DD-endopeptidase MepM/ murein hydrolase activator NlpD
MFFVSGRMRAVGRTAIGTYLVLLHLCAAYFAVSYFYPGFRVFRIQPVAPISDPLPSTPAPTPLPIPSEFVESTPVPVPTPIADYSAASPEQLLIPVKGVKRNQLIDTFTQSRSDGRIHDAIDIMAPAGTPVIAAADGEILKFHDSVAGGTTIYELSADRKFIFYYAHLQSRQPGLNEHDQVKRGTVIGYVGDTGNAGAGNYHLHFAIAEAADPKRWWSGPYINPYPLLLNAVETP